MISKNEYFSLIDKLPKYRLPTDFESRILKELKINQSPKTSSKGLNMSICVALSVLILLTIIISSPTTNDSYAKLGKNAKSISSQISASLLSAFTK